MDDYATCFENIDPLAQYKNWKKQTINPKMSLRTDPVSERVQAVFIVSDPVDWSRDIQVSLSLLQLIYDVVAYVSSYSD